MKADSKAKADQNAVNANVPGSSKPLRSCTCAVSRNRTCDHLKDLSRAVAEVQDGMSVAPDHVYIIPLNSVLMLAGGGGRHHLRAGRDLGELQLRGEIRR